MAFSYMSFVTVITFLVSAQGANGECSGTPLDLQEQYLRNCKNRVKTKYNCSTAWDTFANSFAGKNPENVTQRDYEPYFDILPIIAPPNQSLFWSGTYELAGLVSCMCSTGANLVSSSNTPSSAIINDIGYINWCGNTSGIEYSSNCPCSVTISFWNQFSVEFASVASGTIFYLGYGEREGGAYKPSSAFGSYEIPNLSYPRVTNAVVLNVHRKGEGESCDEGSLIDLRQILEFKNFNYSCYDIYGNLMDPNETESLSICAAGIVTAIQQGIMPEQNDCFSDTVRSATSIFSLVMVAAGLALYGLV